MNDVAQAEDIHAKNREGVAAQAVPAPTRPPTIPLTLRETYDRYKTGKGIGRQDLFGKMVDEIEALQKRIGSVDEAAVSELANRITGLESVIWNALKAQPMSAAEFSAAQQVWDEKIGNDPDLAAATPKRKPGRPSNAEIAAREANNV